MITAVRITLDACTCDCGATWIPKGPAMPRSCPRCGLGAEGRRRGRRDCPVCRASVAMRKDGALMAHGHERWQDGLTEDWNCPGSGKKP